MIWFLPAVPFAAGLAALLLAERRQRRILLLAAAAANLGQVLWYGLGAGPSSRSRWIGIDSSSLLFMGITGVLFLAAAVSIHGQDRGKKGSETVGNSVLKVQGSGDPVFTACLLFFLSTMNLVTLSRHLGLLWVAVEATTLASAPLIYQNRQKSSLEAAWKYLLICSVGIAMALLGNFFLAVSTTVGTGHQIPLYLEDLRAGAASLDQGWLKAAFLLLLVGYGTKMGLAPMHTWLPDAHSEAPPVVSALLSGALLNCAFLGIMRVQEILTAAGLGPFGRQHLVLFGLFSMSIAGFFLLTQTDYKRMLAYSSVEHMGVLALGVGLGGAGVFGAALHAINHSLAKTALFLASGCILAVSGSKKVESVTGLMETVPVTGIIWLAGIMAVVGLPPFGLFTSELVILRAALESSRWWVAAVYLAALSVSFVAMVAAGLRMTFGNPRQVAASKPGSTYRLTAWDQVVPGALMAMVLMTGLFIPGPLMRFLHSVAAQLGAP